jgi:4-amino-4-deoxy-L-arabinose transferase-like glycosyltransferase
MIKLKKIDWILIAILILGISLRIFNFRELFYYAHDQDLIGWFTRDVLENGHLRLIGQETSQHGVFIGALFYYLAIPFYVLFGMDPIGGVFLSLLIAVAAIVSIYFVFGKIWNKHVGYFGSFIYAFSFTISFTDREVVPTTPAMLWTIWMLWAIHLIKSGNQKHGFLLAALLLGFVWHINMALALTVPLIVLAFIISRKRLQIKYAFGAVFLAFLVNLPFVLFEVKSGFSQLQSMFGSVATSQEFNFSANLDRTMQLAYKNADAIFTNSFRTTTFWALIVVGIVLFAKKIISKGWLAIFGIWILLFILFFSRNQINISEYYLNGINIVWIAIAALALSTLWASKKLRVVAILLIILFSFFQLTRFGSITVNKSGYVQRKQIVEFIAQDAKKNNYPCVSVSYVVSPGRDLGYRYLFFLKKLHVNQPKSGAPVYTIVYPHTMVNHLDHTFGDLGLVLPDYSRYNKDQLDYVCSGDNSNLTDPLFGFTK